MIIAWAALGVSICALLTSTVCFIYVMKHATVLPELPPRLEDL